MDTNVMYVIFVVILAVIVIVAFSLFRQRVRIHVQGPFGTVVKVDAFNEPASDPALKGKSSKRRADGRTGRAPRKRRR